MLIEAKRVVLNQMERSHSKRIIISCIYDCVASLWSPVAYCLLYRVTAHFCTKYVDTLIVLEKNNRIICHAQNASLLVLQTFNSAMIEQG